MVTADIIAKAPDGRIILLVEAKNKRGTSPKWAAEMRRNLLTHHPVQAPYFLLATPDRLYFWLNQEPQLDLSSPPVTLDSQPFLGPYLDSAGIGGGRVSGESFELIVASWLRELTRNWTGNAMATYPKQLVESGLFKDLRGALLSHRHG